MDFPVPDSLTTYRLIAVAVGGDELFGTGEAEFRVSKPIGVEPALPRFLRPGDRATAGVVARNRTASDADVLVKATVASGPVAIDGEAERRVRVASGGSVEVPFAWSASAPGEARILFEAVAGAERDALEVVLPVVAVAPSETTATFFAVEYPFVVMGPCFRRHDSEFVAPLVSQTSAISNPHAGTFGSGVTFGSGLLTR